MPTTAAASAIALRPGRPKKVTRKPVGLSNKVRAALVFMVFGPDEAVEGLAERFKPVPRPVAAQLAGLKDDSLRQALTNPSVVQHYRQLLDVLRQSESAASIARMVELRDQNEQLKVSFEAARWLIQGDKPSGSAVNVQVNVTNQQPGYVVGIDPQYADLVDRHPLGQNMPEGAKPLTDNDDVAT